MKEKLLKISNVLNLAGVTLKSNDYDGLLVKQLSSSNTLNSEGSSKQTHIAITGKQMNMFPYVRADEYFNDDNVDFKKYYILEIPISLHENNLNYLKRGSEIVFAINSEICNTTTTVVRSKRKNGAEQLQLSLLSHDGIDFLNFRRILKENDYIIILKIKGKFEYEVIGIPQEIGNGDLQELNGNFYYEKSETLVQAKENIIFEEYNKSNVLEKIEILCNNKKIKHKNIQNLYFGAPGTGKSYRVSEIIKEVYPTIDEKDNPFVFKTTIYADYSYYDFVGNLVPRHNNDKLEYGFTPGIFTQSLAQALNNEDKEVFLVIEEMSRGNVASIFGDIFQLLDRNEEGNSEYSINNDLITNFLSKPLQEGGIGKELKKISLPRNLHIIGTVNTSDQNVNVIDTAFKRRFGFEYSSVEPIKNKETNDLYNTFIFKLGNDEFEWNKLYMSLNKMITESLELSEDKQIGQFFIKFNNFKDDEDGSERFKEIQNKLLNYLWEDVQLMAIDDSKSLFGDNYKTFSKLYKDFGERKNIFSAKLMEYYSKIEID